MFRRITDGVPHPPTENPYDVPDTDGIPAVFCMDARTPLELSNRLLDVAWYRDLDVDGIAMSCGLDVETVRFAIERGKGGLEDVFAICDALGIKVFGLPALDELEKGIE